MTVDELRAILAPLQGEKEVRLFRLKAFPDGTDTVLAAHDQGDAWIALIREAERDLAGGTIVLATPAGTEQP